MRLLGILTALVAATVSFATVLLIRTAAPAGRNPASRETRVAAHVNAQAKQVATAKRVRLGIVSDNLPLFEKQTKIYPAINTKYFAWGTPFPAADVLANHGLGTTTMIVLEPYKVSPQAIVAGRADRYLALWAAAERRLGLPVILSFAPEANGDWYPWGKGHISAALYKKMYREVHNVLIRDGVRCVTWLWQVDRIWHSTESLRRLWPGSAYVNVIGFDGQLVGKKANFYTLFGPTLTQVRRFTRLPVMVSEVAVKRDPSRPTQITGLFSAARKMNVTAVIFFDVEAWNFDRDKATRAAIRAAATSRVSPP